jgi:hypothetical protein
MTKLVETGSDSEVIPPSNLGLVELQQIISAAQGSHHLENYPPFRASIYFCLGQRCMMSWYLSFGERCSFGRSRPVSNRDHVGRPSRRVNAFATQNLKTWSGTSAVRRPARKGCIRRHTRWYLGTERKRQQVLGRREFASRALHIYTSPIYRSDVLRLSKSMYRRCKSL